MRVKWNRMSLLLAIVMGLVILGAFIFGQVYYLNPIKERADLVEQQENEQTSLKAEYPPEETLLATGKSMKKPGDFYLKAKRLIKSWLFWIGLLLITFRGSLKDSRN